MNVAARPIICKKRQVFMSDSGVYTDNGSKRKKAVGGLGFDALRC